MRIHGQNSVYYDSEKRILNGLSKVLIDKRSINIKTREVARAAGIACPSFYIHYRSLTDLLDTNEQKILDGLDLEIRRIMKRKDFSLERRYSNILFYLYKYRTFLNIMARSKNIEIPLKIIYHLKPIVIENWNSYGEKTDEYIFWHFSAEALVELAIWRNERYALDRIKIHARNLAIFTHSAPANFASFYYKNTTNSVQALA